MENTDKIQDYLNDRFKDFKSKPILFIGSGLSRRYINLSDWKSLLMYFTKFTNPSNPFAFRSYETKAKDIIQSENLDSSMLYPQIASCIQDDFNNLVFNRPDIDFGFSKEEILSIQNGANPFKIMVAKHINDFSSLTDSYAVEYPFFITISKKISNIITTNYDCFLEETFNTFHTQIGQKDILNRRSHLVGNVFKIHGSISNPESIVINKNDYLQFEENQKFLSAKILTMLLEFPVIFIGYSISDTNILSIISDIKKCLDPEIENKLAKRLLFIDYAPSEDSQELTEIEISGLKMTKIRLYDYTVLYKAFSSIVDSIDISYLNLIEDKIVQLIETTNKTVDSVYAESLESAATDSDKVAVYIGHPSSVFRFGYSSIGVFQYCEDVLFNNSNYDPTGIIECSVLQQKSRFSHSKLPLWKYISKYNKPLSSFVDGCVIKDLDSLYSESMKNMQLYKNPKKEIHELIDNNDLDKSILNICLCLNHLNLDEVYEYIKEHWEKAKTSTKSQTKTYLTKIVCAIDWYWYYK